MIKNIITVTLLISFWLGGYSQVKNILLIGGDIGAMFSQNDISDLDINNNSFANLGGFTPTNLMGTYGNNSGDYKTFYIDLNVSALYYLTDKFLIGIGIGLLDEQIKYDSELITKSEMISYLISPKFRYYIYQGFYGQIQCNIGKIRQDIKCNHLVFPPSSSISIIDYSTIIEGKTFGFGISAGYSILLGSNLTVDLALRYLRNKNKFEYENISEDGTYNIKQNTALISIGLKYILRKRAN